MTMRGYTLIEMVVVLIIIGVIAGIALRAGQSSIRTDRTEEAKREMDALARAIAGDPQKTSGGARIDFGYVGDVGSLPGSLTALNTNPGSYATWRGPYLRDEFTVNGTSPNLTVDPWGVSYSYNSSTGAISSTGSGTTITRQVAAASADLLLNRVKVMVRDQTSAIPGSTYKDSLKFILTVPNGSGATVDKLRTPAADGNVVYDSIPIGTQLVRVIYTPTGDTVRREITVMPNETTLVSVQLPRTAWATSTNGTGTPQVIALYPNGPGSVGEQLNNTGCSANWQCVDEVTPDGNTSHVEQINGNYQWDTYDFQDPGISSGTIDSINVFAMAMGTHIQSEIRARLRISGTNYDGAIASMNGITSYTFFNWKWTTNPNTSAAWTWANITALEAGIGMKKDSYCTAVHVTVYYR